MAAPHLGQSAVPKGTSTRQREHAGNRPPSFLLSRTPAQTTGEGRCDLFIRNEIATRSSHPLSRPCAGNDMGQPGATEPSSCSIAHRSRLQLTDPHNRSRPTSTPSSGPESVSVTRPIWTLWNQRGMHSKAAGNRWHPLGIGTSRARSISIHLARYRVGQPLTTKNLQVPGRPFSS